MSYRAVKLKGTTVHNPASGYNTVDDATYVRVVSFGAGQNFRVANDSSGSDVVARYAVTTFEVLYIRKESGQYIGGGTSSLRCSAVALEG